MKSIRLLCTLILILTQCTATNSAQQSVAQVSSKPCRIVDELSTEAGTAYYVDGTKVPEDIGILGFVRQRDKSSPCTCLLAFVTTSARIRDVEDLRVIAGKMDYKEFHAYLYDPRYRDFATEIDYYGTHLNLTELRSGPKGPVPLPAGGVKD